MYIHKKRGKAGRKKGGRDKSHESTKQLVCSRSDPITPSIIHMYVCMYVCMYVSYIATNMPGKIMQRENFFKQKKKTFLFN